MKPITPEAIAKPKRRITRALSIGFVWIGVPFIYNLFTIYTLLSPGGQGELRDVFFYVIIALNFVCLMCIGIMWTADLRDVMLENRVILKARKSVRESIDFKKQARAKWIALIASILNTLSSVVIAAILYTQETTLFNRMMVVGSVITILFDVRSLYLIFLFYKKNPELRSPLVEKLDNKFTRLHGKHQMFKASILKPPLAQTALSAAA
jgi:hypothetical protein